MRNPKLCWGVVLEFWILVVVLKDLNNYNFIYVIYSKYLEHEQRFHMSEEGYEGQINPYMFEPVATPTPAMTPNDSKAGSW